MDPRGLSECGQGAKLRGQVTNSLLVMAAIRVPLLLGLADFVFLPVESQLALDEGGGLPLDLGLASGGPFSDAVAKLRQIAMLGSDFSLSAISSSRRLTSCCSSTQLALA